MKTVAMSIVLLLAVPCIHAVWGGHQSKVCRKRLAG